MSKRIAALLLGLIMVMSLGAAGLAQEELEYTKLKFIAVGDYDQKAVDVFTEKVNEMLMRDLNCEIEMQNLTFAEYAQSYPLILASGEEWDCIFSATWVDYANNALKGSYLELTNELIETYMPRTWAVAQNKLDGVKVNGKVYMLPQTSPDYWDLTYWAVRGDLMAEAGLEDITTPEELETYLDYVVENHPEMSVININALDNGNKGGAVAQTFLQEEKYAQFYSYDFQINGIYTSAWILDTSDPTDIKLVDEAESDAYFITLYNKCRELMEKGYWAEDCLSVNNALDTYYATGDGAAALKQLGTVAGWVRALRESHPEYDPRLVRVVDTPMFQPPGTSSGASINPKSKNIERTLMACDLLGYEQEYVDLLRLGLEGVHYTLNDNGSYTKIADPEYDWSIPLHRSFLTSSVRNSTSQIPEYYEFNALYGDVNSITPVHMTFAMDTSEVSTEYAALSEAFARYMPILYTGISSDVEATWYEYKEACKAAGAEVFLEEYIAQMQEYYDVTLGN